MVERVVINPEGKIIRLELLPPFSYLRHVTERVQNSGGSAVEGKTKTSPEAGQCSDYVQSGEGSTSSSVMSGNSEMPFSSMTVSAPPTAKIPELSFHASVRASFTPVS